MDTSVVRSVESDVIGFPDGPQVDVRELGATSWSVLRQFTYYATSEVFDVPANQRTDFASVPRAFVWFIPTYGCYTKAAILHDHLCDLSREGKFHRRDADGLFRQAMRTLGVPLMRRWIMWAAVRWGAVGTADGRKDWWNDAPKVIPITICVLPLLAPAALVIVSTLLACYALEVVAWVPLSLMANFRKQRNRPSKRVNWPELSLKL
jgi:hypothetical protein